MTIKFLLEHFSKSISYDKPIACHSGLSGIFLSSRKDSRRASLAGMTDYKRTPILRQMLSIIEKDAMVAITRKNSGWILDIKKKAGGGTLPPFHIGRELISCASR